MPKILIIEDEVSIRRVLIKILLEESDTYIVDEAEDGKLGFEKIGEFDHPKIELSHPTRKCALFKKEN